MTRVAHVKRFKPLHPPTVIYYLPFQSSASVVRYSHCHCSFAFLFVLDPLFVLFRVAL